MATTPASGQIFDAVATDYDVIWTVPAVKILFPLLDTNLKRLGPWDDAHVLDMACGTGFGLREMKELGATKLVGVDISGEMLEVAKKTSADAGFELHHADCGKSLDHLGLQKGSFDLVLGMWLLNFPESRADMVAFWQNIADYLKPGAKFVGIIQNQDDIHPISMRGKAERYGAQEANVTPLENGDGYAMRIQFDTQPKVEFDTFVMKREVLEYGAAQTGMVDLHYVRAGDEVRGEVDGKDDEWWHELLTAYPNQLVIATKAST